MDKTTVEAHHISTAAVDASQGVQVVGNVAGSAALAHRQGQNDFRVAGDCGLVACENLLRSAGVAVNEEDVVYHAMTTGHCVIDQPAWSSGATTLADQVQVLQDFGVPAHVETGRSLEQLAGDVAMGKSVIASVNSNVLWHGHPGSKLCAPDHAINVIGAARDIASGQVAGFFILDSGTGSAGFVDAQLFDASFNPFGRDGPGNYIVTDKPLF